MIPAMFHKGKNPPNVLEKLRVRTAITIQSATLVYFVMIMFIPRRKLVKNKCQLIPNARRMSSARIIWLAAIRNAFGMEENSMVKSVITKSLARVVITCRYHRITDIFLKIIGASVLLK